MSLQPIVKLVDLSFKHSPEDDYIFEKANLTIYEKDFIGITGKNGSGKTTLLKIVGSSFDGSNDTLLNGEISINGRIGVVSQRPQSQLLTFKVIEEIGLTLGFQRIDRDRRRKIVNDLMTRFDLHLSKDKDPRNISSGEQQVVAILSTIVADIDLLLLDEPASFLDDDNLVKLMASLKELKKLGLTVVISTHHPTKFDEVVNKWLRIENKQLNLDENHINEKLLDANQTVEELEVQTIMGDPYHTNFIFGYNGFKKRFKDNIINLGLVLVIGSNGSGKSTLLKTLASIHREISGEVPKFERSLYIPPDPSILFWQNSITKEFGSNRLPEWIMEHQGKPIFNLSDGMRKLLSIELALLQADIIFFDEPTQSIDQYGYDRFISLIDHHRKTKLLVIATNDLILKQSLIRGNRMLQIINLDVV